MQNDESVLKTQNDGGSETVSDELLNYLKGRVANVEDYLRKMSDTRNEGWNTRLAVWDGQSADGRKHAEDNSDEDVKPFEGACDQRVRLADMLVNDEMMMLVMASLFGQTQITPMDAGDLQKVGRLKTLLRWVLFNKLGYRWMKQLILAANYYLADTPALVWLDVRWRVERYLQPRRLTAQELAQMYVASAAGGTQDEQALAAMQIAADQFVTLLSSKAGDEELMGLLQMMFPDVENQRARKMLADLRRDGRTTFPEVRTKEGVHVQAKRLWEDFYVISGTTDFQTTPVIFECEWLTKPQVEAAKLERGWSGDFIEGVLKHEGIKAIDNGLDEGDSRGTEKETTDYAGLYQVVNAMFTGVNKSGVPGRYAMTFHPDVTVAAGDKELIETLNGEYPGHVLQREVLSKWLLDSRSISELAGADQDMIKLFLDSWGDNAQISAVPPIVTIGRRTMGRLYIEPLAELQAKREGDYRWLAPPQYPASVVRILDQLRDMVNEYHGRENIAGNNQVRVQLARQFKTAWWLANLAEIYKQILQLCQIYMSDEELARVLDLDGNQVIQTREDIAGMFDVAIIYDPRDLDTEDLERRAAVITNILVALDRDQVLELAPIVENYLWRLEPALAGRSIRSVDKARASELEDEIQNYLKILGGIEPEMVSDGTQNYNVRLELYQGMKQKNPAIYESLAPDRRAILEARVQHLAAMVEQYGANAVVGRQGTPGALAPAATGMEV
jgi:hypothetical protein